MFGDIADYMLQQCDAVNLCIRLQTVLYGIRKEWKYTVLA